MFKRESTLSTRKSILTFDDDWWQHAVFYQIYTRSFMDSNGDGIGDLKGITTKMSYLLETGINAIWLNPIFESPMVDFGYDISDYKAIHHEYGTMQDFVELMTAAKSFGIKVILDFVPNHTSDQCVWFQKSVERVEGFEDFYIWSDGKVDDNGERVPPNNWESVFYGSAWTWHEKRQQYYLHQFTVQQPDLNFRNPKVVEAIDDVLQFWLDKGVSGFRVGAVNHLFQVENLKDEPLSGETDDKSSYEFTKHIYTKDLPECYDMVHHWRVLLDQYTAKNAGATRILITEAHADIKLLMEYYENENGRTGSHFPFNMFLMTDLNSKSDARDFVGTIQKWLTYMPLEHIANWGLGNHDNPRIASKFGEEMVDTLNILLLTLPGVAVTYNGEEIGMQENDHISLKNTVDPRASNIGIEHYKTVSRDPERTPFQWNDKQNAGFSTADKTWLPVHPNYKQLNLEQQMGAEKSHYKVYKMLISLRNTPVLSKGNFRIEVLSRAVFAFKRELRGYAPLVIVINLSAQKQTVDSTNLVNSCEMLTVLVASSHSSYKERQVLMVNPLKLAPHEGLVCMLE